MKQKFITKRFSKKSDQMIDYANSIIRSYANQGFKLTLRQLYYQFVARDLIPNSQAEYKKLGNVISDARCAGLIDWEAIEDRTRAMQSHDGVWESPVQIIDACTRSYRKPHWDAQPWYVEVWVEKEALAGVVESMCRELKVPSFSCRGYTSQTTMYDAGRRLASAYGAGKQIKIVHLGDHDPSGIDMTRDIQERLSLFSFPRDCECEDPENGCDQCMAWSNDAFQGFHDITVERIALNLDQIELYNPPPNPAKVTDSRFEAYEAEFGESSWELDALEPRVLKNLIYDSISPIIDMDRWREVDTTERRERKLLQAISNNFYEIREKYEEQIGDDD